MRSLAARPAPLDFDPARAALLVNDMQNAFCSPGGYLEKIGFSIADAPPVVARIVALRAAMRRAGIPVFLMQNGFSPDQREAPPEHPLWHKSNALRHMRAHPETRGQILTHGTWDYELVADLQPLPGDVVLPKATDNGFAGTDLDAQLRARGIATLFICGISSNVGVESAVRAAYHLGYFCAMIADATMGAGPPFVQQATEFNVERFFGWVTRTDDVIGALA